MFKKCVFVMGVSIMLYVAQSKKSCAVCVSQSCECSLDELTVINDRIEVSEPVE